MSYPHDYYGADGYPCLHNIGEGAHYLEGPDYLGGNASEMLPLISTMGRGPRGEGLYVGNVVSTDDTVSFGLYSTTTGELVWQSPNLSPAKLEFKAEDYRDLVPGEPAALEIVVSQGGTTNTTTAYIPAGQQGSLIYINDIQLPRTKDDTYQTTVDHLAIYDRTAYESKPLPRVNDIVFFEYIDEDKYGLALGTIEAVESTTVIFTARTFLQMPPISIGDNGNWYVNGKDTGTAARGEKGDKGDTGERGERGFQGETGEPGETGDPGKDATVRVVRTVQLEPGACAYVNDTDSSPSDAALEFGIPEGRPAKITKVDCINIEPGEKAGAEIEQISSNENTYHLTLFLPRGEDGKTFDVQHGVWTIDDLPEFDPTPINTVFIVVDDDGSYHCYIRGRIAHDAELGGPWTIVDFWNYDQLPDRPFDVVTKDDIEILQARRGRLPVEWGDGSLATVQGNNVAASGASAHAEGIETKASSAAQHVQGKYNVEDSAGKYAHIVGGGTNSARKNIHTLDWSGNADYAGNVVAHDATRSHELVLKADKTYVDDQDVKVKEEAAVDATKKVDDALKAAKEYTDQEIGKLATVAKTGDYNDLLNKPESLTEAEAETIFNEIFE